MINADKRQYNYFTFGASNGYGQPQISKDIKGSISIAIYTTSQSVQDNINYKDANYIGLTLNKDINDTFVIDYGGKKLKVLYTQKQGRYIQAFLKELPQ